MVMGEFEDGSPAYHTTELGFIVAHQVKLGLTKFKANFKEEPRESVQIANGPITVSTFF